MLLHVLALLADQIADDKFDACAGLFDEGEYLSGFKGQAQALAVDAAHRLIVQDRVQVPVAGFGVFGLVHCGGQLWVGHFQDLRHLD